jgi:integrase
VKLGQLRPVHVEQFYADLMKDGCSPGNAKKVSAVFSAALGHAVRVGLIAVNPSAPVAKPKPKEAEIVPFTTEEYRRIREAAAGHRLSALFALAIGTGAREGELLGLGREHIDLEAGTMTIRRSLAPVKGGFLLKEPKSKRGLRVVELPRFCIDALRDHLKRLLAEGHVAARTIFCTTSGDFVAKSWFIRQVYSPLLKRAGVPYRKFHTFRHTHVSQLLAQGESIVDVARRVGDRPEIILKTYAHFLPGNAERLTSRLDALYG